MIKPKTSQDLFNKIRSKFSNIKLGDSEGNVTADPKSAVFFDFEFSENSDNFGRVSISLADGENMKVFYNRGLVEKIDDEAKANWYSFLKELKDFAVQHQVTFDVRDITKSGLTQQDFKNLADVNQTVNISDNMSEELSRLTELAGIPVAEGLTGTKKSSYENTDKTRLIIRHSQAVDENVPGSRSRQINSLYVENEQGERFKYPMKHLAGARAMARHVANGGVPHDDFGKHIIKMSEQIAQLNSFARYASHKDQLNNSVGDIIENCKLKLENMRSYVKNLSKQSHYMKAKESFQPTTIAELDDATRNSLREKFTLRHLDNKIESALPLIHSIMKEYDDRDAEMSTPVDQSAMVQSFLANPEKKLVLRADPAADKMLSLTKFTNKNSMLSSILSDIASRMLTRNDEEDRIANFASQVADDMGNEGSLFFKPDANYTKNKKIAIQLAKRYIDDYKKMQQDPIYRDEVRQDPSKFMPKKDRQGKAKEDLAQPFENWTNRIEAKVNEGISSLPDEDHAGKDFIKVKDLMSKHFPVGTEAVNAVSTLQGLGFDDDDLFDQLGDLADKEGPDACARETVRDYVLKMLAMPAAKNYYSPAEHSALTNAVTANEKDFMKAKEPAMAEVSDTVKERDEPADVGMSPQFRDYAEEPDEIEDVQQILNKHQNAYKLFKSGDDLYKHKELYSDLLDYYVNSGDMPYGTSTAKDGDPINWITTRLADLGLIESVKNEYKGQIDDEYRFRDWLKKTHNKEVTDLKPQEYATISKQYHDEKAKQGAKTEGNEFALAVQKAKAAGMKPGDKFKVGDKEYSLKDAIELAGMQLEDFDFAAESVASENESVKEDELAIIKKLSGI